MVNHSGSPNFDFEVDEPYPNPALFKDNSDVNNFYYGQSTSWRQDGIKTNFQRTANFESYNKNFDTILDQIDLDTIQSLDDIVLPDEMEGAYCVLSKGVTEGLIADSSTLAVGSFAKHSCSSVYTHDSNKIKVLFLSYGKGPLNWIINYCKTEGLFLDLTIVSPELTVHSKATEKLDFDHKYQFFQEDPLSMNFEGETYDFVFGNYVFQHCDPLEMKEFLSLVNPRGVLSGVFPNASRVSCSIGRDYVGIDEDGCGVSVTGTDTHHDPPILLSNPLSVDPRLTRCSLLDFLNHPSLEKNVPLNSGEHSLLDVYYFKNVLPPKIVFPKTRYTEEEQLRGKDCYKFWAMSREIDHPVPASVKSLLSAGTHFFVKNKDDGRPFMMMSTLDGQNVVVYDVDNKKFYLLKGKVSKPEWCNNFISQWELVGEELLYSRPSSINISDRPLFFNFHQLLHFTTPPKLTKGIFTTTAVNMDIELGEGYVVTSPYSMRPNVSRSGIGMSMHIKRVQTIDIRSGGTTKEYVIPVGEEFDKEKHFFRDRGSGKVPNTKQQIDRIKSAITVQAFINLAPALGCVQPAANQINLLEESVKERDDLITMMTNQVANVDLAVGADNDSDDEWVIQDVKF